MKQIKTCFHICLQEKVNETVGLCPTFLTRDFMRKK